MASEAALPDAEETTMQANSNGHQAENEVEDVILRSSQNASKSNSLERNFGSNAVHRRSVRLSRAKTFIWGDHLPCTTVPEAAAFNTSNSQVILQGIKPPEEPATQTTTVRDSDLFLASTLISDAKLARHSEYKEDEKSVRLYHLYHHWGLRYLLYICIIINLGLAIFEKPAANHLLLPTEATIPIEIGCLMYFLCRLFHALAFMERRQFWSDLKNIVVLTTVVLTLADMIIYVAMLNSPLATNAIRWSRPLRPLFLVNFSEARQIRRAFRNIRRTVPDVLNVMILFFINLLIFTLMGIKLLGRRNLKYPDGTPYFKDFFDSFFDLYVLVTTANNPDVMMPAFDKSPWFVLFFVAFIITCIYVFMSIFLAVIYNNYKKHLKNEIRHAVISRRQQLGRAFDILHIKVSGKKMLSRQTFNQLLQYVPPKRSKTLTSILWFVLDEDMDNYVEKSSFLKLADLLNVEVSEIKDHTILIERLFPTIYNSTVSAFIRQCILHRFFRYTFDILILLNAIFIIVNIESSDWVFLSFFLVEIALKLYALGAHLFFRRFWNVFDFIVIGSATITTIIEAVVKDSYDETPTLDALLVLRVLRLVKIIGNFERFHVIVITIVHILPFIAIFGGVLFVFYYSFAIVGMEIFGGLISYHGYGPNVTTVNLFCGNALLNGSDFYRNHYCGNNFNTIMSSMVVLMELTVVNQWHVITAGFVSVTNKAARIYFISFHLICVILILNIFTAFVLEAFILEYSLSKGKMENAMEIKIKELGLGLDSDQTDSWFLKPHQDDILVKCEELPDSTVDGNEANNQDTEGPLDLSHDTDIRFHISKNVRDVEVLLQRMFESELEGHKPEVTDEYTVIEEVSSVQTP